MKGRSLAQGCAIVGSPSLDSVTREGDDQSKEEPDRRECAEHCRVECCRQTGSQCLHHRVANDPDILPVVELGRAPAVLGEWQ
jgi:hypothetical protein